VAAVFVGEGAGLEIASSAEFDSAIAAGVAPRRILFAGPGKSDLDLAHVVAGGIGEIHIESEAEAERLSRVAERLGRVVDVAIRVNPVATGQGGAMLMGGRPSQFGIDEERFLEAADVIETLPGLRLGGVHLFAGTQILDAEILARQWAHGLDVAERLARHLGRRLSTIDLGGGLGIPYFAGERPLDLDRVWAIAGDLQAKRAAIAEIAGARIVLEPGRHLAGPSGLYVARVVEVKVSRGERFVIVDGGMNHHLAASGNLGQVIKRDYPVVAATKMTAPMAGPAAVVGPLCTPLDAIARKTELPEVGPGDLVAVLQSGAYGLTASPLGFLSHPAPAEVLVDAGGYRLVRERRRAAVPAPVL
jgi:diaminopimelate decarboxylase